LKRKNGFLEKQEAVRAVALLDHFFCDAVPVAVTLLFLDDGLECLLQAVASSQAALRLSDAV